MRKLPREHENPIDDVLMDFAEWICPTLKGLGFTPNILTTFSLVFGFLSIIALYNNYSKLFTVLFFIGYIFDTLDGHFARKYDMVTVLGDYYDHGTDIFIFLCICIVVYIKYRDCVMFKPLATFVSIVLVVTMMHIGYQERIYPNSESPTLAMFKHLSYGDPKTCINYTKHCGFGTFNLIFPLTVAYMASRCSHV